MYFNDCKLSGSYINISKYLIITVLLSNIINVYFILNELYK